MASRPRIVIFYTVCTVVVLLVTMSLRAIYPDTIDGQTSKKGSKMVTEVAEHTVQCTDASRWLRSEWWKIHIQTVCKALRKTIQVGSVDGIQSNMLVDDDHKILMCRIPKAASKTLTKIFAVLTGAFRGSHPEDIPSRQVYTKYRPLLKQFQKLPYDAVLYRVMNYFRFLFVREPFERLLSAFRDKLIEPPHGYFGRIGKSIIKLYRKNKTVTGPIKFSEFVAYLVDPKRKIYNDNHFRPYYELCRPCDVNYDFLGKLETLGDDLRYIFEMNNLTGQVVLPVGNTTFQSFHRTDLYLEKYYSQVPNELLWKLYDIYYPDLLLFNYSVPDVIKRLLM